MHRSLTAAAVVFLVASAAVAATPDEDRIDSDLLAGLELRGLGPAINSGRVSDFAVDPDDRARYFVAVASGGVWRTDNAGTTWTPVFDDEGSYSTGCVTLDPANPHVVWVGTGENNSQRSVSFGDGVYRSDDGGATWTMVGLESSEHIGMIVVDPRDSDTVWVAAQGPLWASGGDRGLYRTTDGGATWERMLHISDDTGVSEVHLDPRNPDVMIASAYQRRRHVWTLINGGPESGIWRSTDGGETWTEVEEGLPDVDKGRIGLAISPADPDVVYAIVEAARDEGGIFRSTDRGASWSKMSDYMSGSPQYYNELVADPHDVDTVYSMDTFLHVTRDGGETWTRVNVENKHVDDHAMWIDPEDPDYLLVGCDGGVYESFDRGESWSFKANLPVTQFYRATVDTSEPFYWIYGGTQDNNSLGGPTRTLHRSGISNEDWIVTLGGDGFKTQVDPTDPNIVYSQLQYGVLVRYDKRTGETVDIQPQEAPGEPPNRWNWDSPLIISPHSPTRLYFASQRLYRSDDRGSSWRPVSGDLTRQLDRNRLPVMGRLWGMDAVSKNMSTSAYGNIVSLAESPLAEGLLWVGTDDGLVQVSEDGGATWRAIEELPGVPERAYVSRLEASLHDPDTVYAAFDNHKMGDFTPYLLVSTDRGRSWRSIRGDLPDREIVWAVVQDHVEPNLLFAGTELGLYVSLDGGERWTRMKGGLPTIAIRDLDVQRRESDLALGSFGRGFFILDDYTPLRHLSEETAAREALLFPVRDADLYVEKRSRQGSRGDGFFTAPNPPFGALVTYYLRDGLKTRAELRIEAEKEAREAGDDPLIVSADELRAEAEETEPQVQLVIRDAGGEVVRRIAGERKAGLHRTAWDLRYPSAAPVELGEEELSPWDRPDRGPLVLPGTYSVTLVAEEEGAQRRLAGPEEFQVELLDLGGLGDSDPEASAAFRRKVISLRRAVLGAVRTAGEVSDRLDHLKEAIRATPPAGPETAAELERLRDELNRVQAALRGDRTRSERNIPQTPSIRDRVERIAGDQWYTTTAPTGTHREGYRYAAEAFADELTRLRQLVGDLQALESELERMGAPWTPGRLPDWQLDPQQ